jgi:hypothetical protein
MRWKADQIPPVVRTSAFSVLCRAFFARFFASETVTSDIQLRQTLIWVMAFLLTPGVLLLLQLFPQYQYVVIRANRFQTYDIVDDMLEWIAGVFVVYSMVTVGLATVFVWDTLGFDHRDAMVLGPLPLRGRTIIMAKLSALAAFLLAAALPMNLLHSFFFAFETADQLGGGALVAHFVALLTATLMAAAFVFCALITVRGAVALVAGPQFAASVGSVLQFAFVVALFAFVILSPGVWKIPSAVLNNPTTTGWLPPSWFLGLFERLRGSTRPYFMPLGIRALVATPIAIGGAVLVSVLGFRRQMQFALSRPASADPLGVARAIRRIARTLAGRDPVARATSDFVLLTIARNRAQHTPIALSLAVGVAIAIAGLTRSKTIAGLMHPRTIVLWIPLLMGYWMTIGLRASAFMPSELAASWTFRSSAPVRTRAYWAGTRSAMIAIVVPSILLIALAVTAPLLGWRYAAWHAAFVACVLVATIELVTLTMSYIPFTTPYRPGHAKLRTRWPLYFFGMWAAAYWPVRFELQLLGGGELLLFSTTLAGGIGLHFAGRRAALRWSVEPREEFADDGWNIAVLDIGRVVHGAHVGS